MSTKEKQKYPNVITLPVNLITSSFGPLSVTVGGARVRAKDANKMVEQGVLHGLSMKDKAQLKELSLKRANQEHAAAVKKAAAKETTKNVSSKR